jgi:hypothetical protein
MQRLTFQGVEPCDGKLSGMVCGEKSRKISFKKSKNTRMSIEPL